MDIYKPSFVEMNMIHYIMALSLPMSHLSFALCVNKWFFFTCTSKLHNVPTLHMSRTPMVRAYPPMSSSQAYKLDVVPYYPSAHYQLYR